MRSIICGLALIAGCSPSRSLVDSALDVYVDVRQLCIEADRSMAEEIDRAADRTIAQVMTDGFEGETGFDEWNRRMEPYWRVSEAFTFLRGAFVEIERAYEQVIRYGERGRDFLTLLGPLVTYIRSAIESVSAVTGLTVPRSLEDALGRLGPLFPERSTASATGGPP